MERTDDNYQYYCHRMQEDENIDLSGFDECPWCHGRAMVYRGRRGLKKYIMRCSTGDPFCPMGKICAYTIKGAKKKKWNKECGDGRRVQDILQRRLMANVEEAKKAKRP